MVTNIGDVNETGSAFDEGVDHYTFPDMKQFLRVKLGLEEDSFCSFLRNRNYEYVLQGVIDRFNCSFYLCIITITEAGCRAAMPLCWRRWCDPVLKDEIPVAWAKGGPGTF